ncbi:MAG: tRNA dimethylallyltransferase, partial [Patescibacteria group bacterium]|nr:tRNA dimethylallyltransferase [Patescibacteria group bacterium]
MIIIGGPTNSGKTGLAIEIAKIVDAEVISADSRQIYKNMDVGTGKIPIGSNVKIVKNKTYWIVDGVKVWGFDLINPDEIYSAADFFNYYSKVRKNIESRGKEVILAGGTGFYIDTVLRNGVSSTVKVNHTLRQKLNKLTAGELLARLPSAVAQTLNPSERQTN